jgi:hypothetical protein
MKVLILVYLFFVLVYVKTLSKEFFLTWGCFLSTVVQEIKRTVLIEGIWKVCSQSLKMQIN